MLGKTLVTIVALALSTLAPVAAHAKDTALPHAAAPSRHAAAKKAEPTKSTAAPHAQSTEQPRRRPDVATAIRKLKSAPKRGAAMKGEPPVSHDLTKPVAKASPEKSSKSSPAVAAAVVVPVVVETRRNAHDPRVAIRHGRHGTSAKAASDTKNEVEKETKK